MTTFYTIKNMRTTPKVEAAKQMARDAQTVTGIAVNAVGRRDMEIYEMASSAIKQVSRPVEAFDEELGGAA